MGLTITVTPHPLVEIGAFVTRFTTPLGQLGAPETITRLVDNPGPPEFTTDDALRTLVRNLLRAGGFKPAGRSKPAPEYLIAARAEARFPRINAAVDACNVVSLHTGLPISLVDIDRVASQALQITCAPADTRYVFNPTGQIIDAGHLLCVMDAEGPTGTPVKDAQRTKTTDATVATLSIVWGTRDLPGRTAAATQWYRSLVATIPGATIENVPVS